MSTKDKLRVAFLHPDLGIGGAERLVLDVASALANKGHEIIFLTNHYDPSHAFEDLRNGDFIVETYGDWLPRSIFGKCQALCAYFRMIYLTIIHFLFHWSDVDLYFVDLIPIAIPILRLANRKVIYYCHHPDLLASAPGGTLKKLYRKPIDWLELKSTAQADVLLVNSEYTASVFRKTFPEIQKPIQVLYPTIAYAYQETVRNIKNPKSIHELLPEISDTGSIVFLSVNRFHPAKKLDLAILAMENLKQITSEEEWKEIYLIVAGGYDPQSVFNSDYFDYLDKLVCEKNLEHKVIFLKSPSDQFKAELLMACDCLIYTPVKEHFGIVPLEAMNVCKPVIACNSGGPRETVEDGVSGYLCEPTPEGVAQSMLKIVRGENVKAMGIRGKTNLDEKFSYESFCKNINDIIGDFVDKKND